MIGIFEQEGTLVKPEGNRPLPLDGGSRIWLVRSGPVDIFGVLTSNGEPTGPRVHLFRAGEGQLLFSAGAGLTEYVSLLAVGAPGCEVLQLELPRFKELICSEPVASPAEKALEKWVSGLSLGVQSGTLPKYFQYLEPEKETTVAEGTNIRVEAGILWVAQLEGSSRFMGRTGLPEIGPADVFPLCDQGLAGVIGRSKVLYKGYKDLLAGWIALACPGFVSCTDLEIHRVEPAGV